MTTETASSLFPSDLIPASILACLPDAYTIRPLRRDDYGRGFLDVLRVLTTVGPVTEAQFCSRFDYMASQCEPADPESRRPSLGTYFVIVVCDGSGAIVGTGALIVERKFIHSLGLVGHIEDIAVKKDQQGKRLGLRIIETLDAVAREVGCYKSILDCSEANEGFYVKCGFQRAGLEMAHYYEPPKTKYESG